MFGFFNSNQIDEKRTKNQTRKETAKNTGMVYSCKNIKKYFY